MLRIGATQRYHDPLAAGINEAKGLSKPMKRGPKLRSRTRILTHCLPLYFPEVSGNTRRD